MAWERRGGRAYYYRSVRVGERVKKEYLGAGEVAEALAQADETIRRVRELERARGRAEAERLEDLADPVLRLDEAAEVLLRAELVAAGFHRHKGVWRRGRNA
jgi:hypothetical protein